MLAAPVDTVIDPDASASGDATTIDPLRPLPTPLAIQTSPPAASSLMALPALTLTTLPVAEPLEPAINEICPLLLVYEFPVLTLTEPLKLAAEDPVASNMLPLEASSLLPLSILMSLAALLLTATAPPCNVSNGVPLALAPTPIATSPATPVSASPVPIVTLPLLADAALSTTTIPLVPATLAPLEMATSPPWLSSSTAAPARMDTLLPALDALAPTNKLIMPALSVVASPEFTITSPDTPSDEDPVATSTDPLATPSRVATAIDPLASRTLAPL